jgi:hypothetical protein
MANVDKSVTILIPTRDGRLDTRFVGPLLGMVPPLSARREYIFTAGLGVAEAYNALFAAALKLETTFIMTIEDDNIVERGTLVKLVERISDYDAISALYHLKDPDERVPLVFGQDLLPQDLQGQAGVVSCGGIPFGCALWRASLFRDLPAPWFRTCDDPHERRTHDLDFARTLQRRNKRVAVALDVPVGHMDFRTGKIF